MLDRINGGEKMKIYISPIYRPILKNARAWANTYRNKKEKISYEDLVLALMQLFTEDCINNRYEDDEKIRERLKYLIS